jgi:hypothetical protein
MRATDHIPANSDDLDAVQTELTKADRAFLPIVSHSQALVSKLSDELGRSTRAAELTTEQYHGLDGRFCQLENQHRQLWDQFRELSLSYQDEKITTRILDSQIRALRAEAQQEREVALTTGAQIVRFEQELKAQTVELQSLTHLRSELNNLHESYARLSAERDLLLSSTIWRMSAPVRSLAGAIPPRARLPVRRAAKLLYRTITAGKTRQSVGPIRRQQNNVLAEVRAAAQATPAPAARTNSDDLLLSLAHDAAAPVMGNIDALGQQHVCIGVIAHKPPLQDILRLIASATTALARCGGDVTGEIRILDNGGTLNRSDVPEGVIFDQAANEGFGAGHNRCMEAAFGSGATVYIATNPDGSFHPDCIKHLLAMHHAQDGQALIEARQFPEEHPKYYDPTDLTTPWVSGACLLIPEPIWRKTGGFDTNMFLYCEDVDLSWTCRAMGFRNLICPAALFWHDTSNRTPELWRWREMLLSGRYLAHKWRDPKFQVWAENRLLEDGFVSDKEELPPVDDLPTAPQADGISDFKFMFHFAPVRW